MLDHVFVEAIGALRRALESALLQRNAVEERFQVDLLLGDVTWETSYTLPFEGVPPRVQAEIVLEWPTWSQSAYRSWTMGEPPDDPPVIEVEVVLRVQRLAVAPDVGAVLAALPTAGPAVLGEALERATPTLEQHGVPEGGAVASPWPAPSPAGPGRGGAAGGGGGGGGAGAAGGGGGAGAAGGGGGAGAAGEGDDTVPQFAVEVAYTGPLGLDEEVLEQPGRLDGSLAALGSWIASALVGLADLDLTFLPPQMEEEGLR